MRKLFALASALPLTTACATVSPAPPVVIGAGECRNDALSQFTGREATAVLGAEILKASGAKTLQWIPTGTVVTMEFRSDRVRVSLDPQNRVTLARCG